MNTDFTALTTPLDISHVHHVDHFTNWFSNLKECKFPHNILYPNSRIQHFFYISPHTKHYYSSFNPLFSFILPFFDIRKFKYVLLRDGLVPLLLFLYTNNPSRFKNHFLVHSRFRTFIPQKWKKKIDFYSILNNKIQTPPRKRLLIFGVFYVDHMDQAYLDHALSLLKETFLSKKSKRPVPSIELLLTINDYDHQSQKTFIDFIIKLNNTFGEIKKIWNSKEIFIHNKFQDYYTYDLNSGHFLADSYLNHYFCSHNGHMISDPSIEIPNLTKKFKDYPLSPNHFIRIFKHSTNYPTKEIDRKSFNLFMEMSSQFNSSFFTLWPEELKNFIKNKLGI